MTTLAWRRTGFNLAGYDADSVRAVVAKAAGQMAGLGAKSCPDAYAAAIGCDLEGPEFRRDYVPTGPAPADWRTSSCGLFARSVLRHLGCSSQALKSPYLPGSAISGLERAARDAHAWRTVGAPSVGAVVLYGPRLGATSGQHVSVVTAVSGWSVSEVAGGASGGWSGGTETAAQTRAFSVDGTKLVATTPAGVRLVRGWIDTALLPWTLEAALPDRDRINPDAEPSVDLPVV